MPQGRSDWFTSWLVVFPCVRHRRWSFSLHAEAAEEDDEGEKKNQPTPTARCNGDNDAGTQAGRAGRGFFGGRRGRRGCKRYEGDSSACIKYFLTATVKRTDGSTVQGGSHLSNKTDNPKWCSGWDAAMWLQRERNLIAGLLSVGK